MPPKVTENRPSPESLHKVEAETALAARRVVASYADDVTDGVTLMCMLGIEPEGLVFQKFAEEYDLPDPNEDPKKATKKSTAKKTTAKKTTAKKTASKAAKKTTTKKSTAKKTTAKKTSKKSTAKKTTAKKTTAKATKKTTAEKS